MRLPCNVGAFCSVFFFAALLIIPDRAVFGGETEPVIPVLPAVITEDSPWKLTVSGFVELDVIYDTTRSLTEVIGNGPIDPFGTTNGANGRTQFSVRDSRIALNLDAPAIADWQTRAYLEADFLGFDPAPGATNSENSFFNNPTLRIRHAYLQGNHEGLQILAGQTWQLFGWQPYYFMTAAEVSPLPGMTYGRTAQLRAMQTFHWGDTATLQAALSVSRPPQRDAIYPDFQAGVRIAFDGRSSGFTGGGPSAVHTQPLSFAISGVARQFIIPGTSGAVGDTSGFFGSAVAFDAMIPILASPDGKSVSHTLSLVTEITTGSGDGDQFVGWTGNLANPLNSSSFSPSKNVNLDGGLGDYDANGNFALVSLATLNVHLQYHFDETWRTFLDLGVSELYSNNANVLLPKGGLTSAGKVPYNRELAAFANVFHNFTDQLRVGLEYAHVETGYGDGNLGIDNRYQLTTYFIF
jgi:hypothetical protein